MGNPAHTPRGDGVRSAVEPVVATLGLDLEDISVQASGKRRRVCVVLDRDGGMDLDAIAQASRALSDALDESDAMGEDTYTLEVTSPGIDRPLTLPRHWRRNVDRRVRVQCSDGSMLDARIRSVDDDGVTLAVDSRSGPETEERRMPWADLARGEVQIEFRRPGGSQEES